MSVGSRPDFPPRDRSVRRQMPEFSQDFCNRRKSVGETRLAGWVGSIRTRKSRDLDRSNPTKADRRWVQFRITKDWTSAAKGASVSVTLGGPPRPSGILPRWPCRHCGASVVTVDDAVVIERIPNVATQHLH
jgi:hypothetical protein